jgi:hypothetical protein
LLLVWACDNVNAIHISKDELIEQICTNVFEDKDKLVVNVFQTELAMIKNFLTYVSLEIDVLIGYNSKNFDIPFLVLRANILSNRANWFLKKNLNCFYLSTFTNKSMNQYVSVKSQKKYKIKFKCPDCNMSSCLDDFKTVSSSKNKNQLCKNLNCLVMKEHVITENNIYLEETVYDKTPEFIFTLHRDLIRDKNRILGDDSTSRRLEDKCNEHFREKCNILDQRDDTCEIRMNRKISSVADSVQMCRTYMIGVKMIICTIDIVSKQIKILLSGRLGRIYFSATDSDDKFVVDKNNFVSFDTILHEKFKTCKKYNVDMRIIHCDTNCDTITVMTDQELYCTIGKTSDQSIANQLIWNSKEGIFSTINYCIYDVLLTFALERKCQTLFDILSRKFNKMTCSDLLDAPAGVKSTVLLLYSLYGKTALICSQGLTFLKYFQDALNVECVKIEEQDQFDHVLKIECNKTLDDYLNLNTPNSNEYTLGIMGEYDPSDLTAIKRVLDDFK